MSENTQNLSQKIANALEFGSDVEIPSYITQNLNKDLREYQITALKHFYLQRKNPQTNHLMFNMATGSGKTLIMAALMLDLYKRGYREFVFFVNSNAIVEKTRDNFCNKTSSKYLFSESIIIDSKRVEVRSVDSFSACDSESINISFNTIQGLHSLFIQERENSLTLADLKGRKIVLIADEAHHLNTDTKSKLTKEQEIEKQSWEGTIKSALGQNSENLLLEFSATIPNDESVLNKYRDKIVYEYALKQFYNDRYSKKIFLVKYESRELKELFLGACILSLFRQFVGRDSSVYVKPVILFKSGSIAKSKENEKDFYEFLEKLDSKEIERFLQNVDSSGDELLQKAKGYFEKAFENYAFKVAEHIKASFDKSYCINMNDEKDLEANQKKLNTLESRDNALRVIFAVDRLNEGWDVLNLYDIVRLDNAKDNNKTTSNAQLIGRGARYYPFYYKEGYEVDKRKFDNEQNALDVLEALSYHSFNESSYITALQKELENQGTPAQDTRTLYKLQPQEKALTLAREFAKNATQDSKDVAKHDENLSLPIMSNDIRKLKENESLFHKAKEIENTISTLSIPLLGSREKSQVEAYKKQEFSEDEFAIKSLKSINKAVFLKAMNKEGIGFNMLKNLREVGSKREFIEKHLYTLEVRFHKKQEFSRASQLHIATFIVKRLKEILNAKGAKWEIEPFRIKYFTLRARELWSEKELEKSKYQWLVYDKMLKADSSYEGAFLDFINDYKDRLDETYQHWCVIRNECFSEFKLFGRDNAGEVRGFNPDFVFFGVSGDNKEVLFECVIEAKGEQLESNDKWKENLLLDLESELVSVREKENNAKNLRLRGLGFFSKAKEEYFKKEFTKVVLGA
ncbi:DEAD/DEAH box helicase family protein [Helicobacter bilis]|uniref:DEAD/DEAH box helicase family protein n=1 Tax=Helicobacter bilis TaxID=37372 RepID=UPI0026EDE3C3|nr:DEAD/DEAH box helicase family protein [Helicobacter bilis]MCI7410153.1 DEAD/DEAH box helicase family protein [Helicobacter bilis]MDD7297131.1 DEAD/DEAH box helicase family protein [Helicobacter bilis]MDY4401062.1 DEAD/DEAH box helicase family protein [Helicobacter bilis]